LRQLAGHSSAKSGFHLARLMQVRNRAYWTGEVAYALRIRILMYLRVGHDAVVWV
jgi:hypothetical protein